VSDISVRCAEVIAQEIPNDNVLISPIEGIDSEQVAGVGYI
jgi:hypothetical protein